MHIIALCMICVFCVWKTCSLLLLVQSANFTAKLQFPKKAHNCLMHDMCFLCLEKMQLAAPGSICKFHSKTYIFKKMHIIALCMVCVFCVWNKCSLLLLVQSAKNAQSFPFIKPLLSIFFIFKKMHRVPPLH